MWWLLFFIFMALESADTIIVNLEEENSLDHSLQANILIDVFFFEEAQQIKPKLISQLTKNLKKEEESDPELFKKISIKKFDDIKEENDSEYFARKIISNTIAEVMAEKERDAQREIRKKKYAIIGSIIGLISTTISGLTAIITNIDTSDSYSSG